MRRKLTLDTLRVTSFETERRPDDGKGTVRAHQIGIDSADGICSTHFCPTDPSGLQHSCVWSCLCSNHVSCTYQIP